VEEQWEDFSKYNYSGIHRSGTDHVAQSLGIHDRDRGTEKLLLPSLLPGG